MKIVICSNREDLGARSPAEGGDDDIGYAAAGAAHEAIEALLLARGISLALVDIRWEGSFSAWNGGYCTRMIGGYNHVRTDEDSDLAMALAVAGNTAMDEVIDSDKMELDQDE